MAFVGGHWASGLPYIDLDKKTGGLHDAAAFLPLLHLDSSGLRDAVLAEPPEAWTAEGQKVGCRINETQQPLGLNGMGRVDLVLS